MRKLYRANIFSTIGMGALWMSLFKRVMFPVLHTFYRTGADGGQLAQGIYAAALVLAVFGLLLVRERIDTASKTVRLAMVALGVCGAIGIAILANSKASQPDEAALVAIGGVLAALFVPAHFAFWGLYAHGSDPNGLTRSIAWSFGMFAGALLLLELLGANTAAVSVACPLVSAAMVIACPADAAPAAAEATAAMGAAETSGETALEDAAGAGGGENRWRGRLSPVADDARMPDAGIPLFSALGGATSSDASPESEAISGASSESTSSGSASVPDIPAAGGASGVDIAPAAGTLPEGFADAFGLSGREAELAACAHRNLSARRIASELFIAESTVYTHLKRIYRKTDVHSKHELIDLIDAWAASHGEERGDGGA